HLSIRCFQIQQPVTGQPATSAPFCPQDLSALPPYSPTVQSPVLTRTSPLRFVRVVEWTWSLPAPSPIPETLVLIPACTLDPKGIGASTEKDWMSGPRAGSPTNPCGCIGMEN